MQINTKIGIGEIVCRDTYKGTKLIASHFLKVVCISIDAEKTVTYHCEYPDTGYVRAYKDSEIVGDPDFDQEKGYPE